MNRKSRLRIVGTNLLLFVFLFGLISLNKGFFRPELDHLPFFRILTGCFPNFIAAYMISLAFVNAILIGKPKCGRIIVFVGSLLVFAILAIEELKPMWGASTHYDSYDILASGIGSLLSILTFESITWKRKTQNEEN